MKKIWNVLANVILAFLAFGIFAYVTQDFYHNGYGWNTEENEYFCYAIWGLVFAIYFWQIGHRFKTLRSQILAGTVTSFLYTLTVFLANNFWRYLCIAYAFEWEFIVSLKLLMKWDITYTRGWGEFRYPMVFAIMALFCGIRILISRPKIEVIYLKWLERFYHWRYIRALKEESLEELYEDAVENSAVTRLADYIQNMPLTEEGKNTLMAFLEEHNNCFLIRHLFLRYESFLTKEEYVRYRALFVKIVQEYQEKQREYYEAATVEFPEIMEKLDEKFEISSEV